VINLIFVIPQDHMLPTVINKNYFLNFYQTCHIVYCPHSRLPARQANDVLSVLAGPLKHRLAALICTVHPTGCTTAVVQLWLKNTMSITTQQNKHHENDDNNDDYITVLTLLLPYL